TLAAAYWGRGLARRSGGIELEEAVDDCRRAIALEPTYEAQFDPESFAAAYCYRARLHIGSPNRAFADYSAAIELLPNCVPAYAGRAPLQALGSSRQIEDYSRLIRLDPGEGAYYHGRGQAYRERGSATAALRDFRRASELRYAGLEPDLARALRDEGLLHEADAEYGRYVRRYGEALQSDRWIVGSPREEHARVRLRLRRFDLALKDYDWTLEAQDSPAAFFGRGVARSHLGDQDGAFDDYSRAAGPDGLRHAAALDNRGYINAARQDVASALGDWCLAVEASHERFTGAFAGVDTTRGEERLHGAISAYMDHLGLDPVNVAVAHLYRGFVLELRGELEEARDEFSEAIRIAPSVGLAFRHRGQVFERLGQKAEAIRDYGQATTSKYDGIALTLRAEDLQTLLDAELPR
ncbi:tetratricopeptide repeat protein, partial [Planctomycetota bacterium]|nr:tetratricopeptide repeat protein [Planctomycetota bacterium]